MCVLTLSPSSTFSRRSPRSSVRLFPTVTRPRLTLPLKSMRIRSASSTRRSTTSSIVVHWVVRVMDQPSNVPFALPSAFLHLLLLLLLLSLRLHLNHLDRSHQTLFLLLSLLFRQPIHHRHRHRHCTRSLLLRHRVLRSNRFLTMSTQPRRCHRD